jgi:predicted amidohydrolase
MSAQGFHVAAIQMVSAASVDANLAAAEALIAEAAARSARLVVLPENFAFMGARERDKLAVREADGAGPIQEFLARAAARHSVWLVGGSIPLDCGDADRVANTCLVYDATGRRIARYDKIHLFSFEQGDERYAEARTVRAGNAPLAIDSPFGRIALSVCYDLRFPELYRALAPFDLATVPSAFTVPTGEAHWETLLRARAIENLAWVIAPAQGGRHAGGRETWGHTMIVDPWGAVRAIREHGPGVVVAAIDPDFQREARESLPALTHRVL